MNSSFFQSIGLNMDPGILFLILFLIIVIMAICLFVLLVRYGRIKTSYELFMQGKKGKNLEEQIAGLFEDIEVLKSTSEKNKKDIKRILVNLKETYQRVGIVKYDAFKEMGGKLSFSIAMLNDNSTGFILNSVHSSDGCYVYTKEIINGECAISLGDEEKKALTLALQEDQGRPERK
ncbi:MAG: DUF4446 family protein [Lachnospiraceae bacterium]|nr:DUF4446 family protein [Lachnospiraceae bacterium]